MVLSLRARRSMPARIMPTPQGTAASRRDWIRFRAVTATALAWEKRYVWLPLLGAGNAAGADRAMPGAGAEAYRFRCRRPFHRLDPVEHGPRCGEHGRRR